MNQKSTSYECLEESVVLVNASLIAGVHAVYMQVDLRESFTKGGARSQHLNDPRAAMTTWALSRVEKEMPSLPSATASMLLKAESRTVTAVLNARTWKQVIEVTQAAMRRAGIPVTQPASQQPMGPAVPHPPPPSSSTVPQQPASMSAAASSSQQSQQPPQQQWSMGSARP